MHASRAQTMGFWIIALITTLASCASAITLWPKIISYASRQSASLTASALQANGGESLVDYQLATWLNPANSAAYAGLAVAQLANNQPNAALVNIANAGDEPDLLPTSIRARIELGQYQTAASLVKQMLAANPTDANLVLAIESLALAHDTSQIQALMTHISSPNALQAAQRVESGDVSFAQQLYSTGLPNASKSMLLNLPVSFERNMLLATIDANLNSTADLYVAQTLLEVAITINPSSVPARQLLIQIDRDNNNLSGASREATLAHSLQSGTP
jgi:hypothetical protein